MITIENKKVHDLIVTKDELVTEGRKISQKIEDIELKCRRFEDKEKAITSKIVPPKELIERGDAITAEMAKLENELNKIGKQIHEAKLSAIPSQMKEDHMALLKEKEVLERDRNKIALKVQKIKDKIVPVIQKEVTPLLQTARFVEINVGKYDDIGTAKTKDGKIIIDKFNWFEDWAKKFGK